MPPLARQVSRESIYSDWSDTKPPGPTINLHAIAKPLMRFMYHQQASKFMKKNRDVPLSPKNIEICLSWLEYKYVGVQTKTKILAYIAKQEVANSLLMQSKVMDEFLQAANAQIQIYACDVLVNLAAPRIIIVVILNLVYDENTSNSVIRANPSASTALVARLRDEDPEVGQEATKALAWMAFSAEGAEAVLSAGILDRLEEVLKLPDQAPACWVLEHLASHESTASLMLRANPCQHIVALLGRDNTTKEALSALQLIAESAEGAHAVVEAGTLQMMDMLFESADDWVRGKSSPSDDAPGVASDAIYALSQVTEWADGAEAVVEAGAYRILDKLLNHANTNTDVRERACSVLGNLARFQSTAPSSDADSAVSDNAVGALSSIAYWADGAAAVIEAGTLQVLDEFMQSANVQLMPSSP
ncbi:armadillo-type protein [Mycena leptocephala]|nr:armadillo-type protein [Mycena leptocephala]